MGQGYDGDGEKGTGEGRILMSLQNGLSTLAMQKKLVMSNFACAPCRWSYWIGRRVTSSYLREVDR